MVMATSHLNRERGLQVRRDLEEVLGIASYHGVRLTYWQLGVILDRNITCICRHLDTLMEHGKIKKTYPRGKRPLYRPQMKHACNEQKAGD